MAAAPTFGGTNGVPELDIGQPGSVRYLAKKMSYTAKVLRRPPNKNTIVHSFPEQICSYENRLGWSGETCTWEGNIRVENTTEIGNLISELTRFDSGFTVDATTGVHSLASLTLQAPTILKDAYGIAMGSRCVMEGFQFGRNFHRILNNPDYLYGNTLRVVFRIMG